MSAPPRIMLIIDDEERVSRVLAQYFTIKGYQVTTFTSGEDALTQAETLKPQVILLDLMMPDMSGFEVLQRLKQRHPQWPVVIVSATDRQEAEPRALQLGADAFLTKPVDFSTLSATIDRLIHPTS